MADDGLGPDDLTSDGLPTARRGYQRRAVDELLEEAARTWAGLAERHRRLLEEIEAHGGVESLERDLREVGERIGRLLGDAQQAAEAVRARAAEQAEARLAGAEARAADIVAEAEGQAFRLRGDAWDAGVELLAQVQASADAIIEQAEADVLIIRAAAEQDAHRRVAEARREAGEITRTARFEGERTVGEARRLADRLVADARREAGDADTAGEPPVAGPDWAVKVISEGAGGAERPPSSTDPHHPDYGDALADEVASLLEEDAVAEPHGEEGAAGIPEPAAEPSVQPEPDEPPTDEPPTDELSDDEGEPSPERDEPESEEEPGTESGERPVTESGGAEIAGLFERLRDGRPAEPLEPEPSPGEPAAPPAEPPLELRERRLLPVVNAGVREVRSRLVEMQNVGLDAVRTLQRGQAWEPDAADVEREMTDSLRPMLGEAVEAGAAAAAEICGGRRAAAPAPQRGHDLLRSMACQLTEELDRAASVDRDRRATLAEVGRAFRTWRNDQVDRWVRAIAYSGYHEGLLAGLAEGGVGEVAGVRHGRLCRQCPAGTGAPWHPAGDPPPGTLVPPADVDCTCCIAPHP